MEKKVVSTSQNSQFSSSKNKLFLEKLFPPNSNNGFHLQKNIFDSLFPPDRKSISTIRIKDLLKNMFSLNAKVASAFKKSRKKIKKLVFSSRNVAVFKHLFSPNFSNSFYQQKRSQNKTVLFPVAKNWYTRYTGRNRCTGIYFSESQQIYLLTG